MESARRHFLDGKMTEDEYRRKACIATILALEDHDYYLEGQLGVGTFGVIVELVNRAFRQKVAAKIVLQEFVSESEVKLWPSIKHKNILGLNDILYVPETYCYVFFMDKQTAALDKLLDDPSFRSDVHNFEKAMTWLRGIIEGVKYLHHQKLAHLDLKLGNVLISKSDVSKICDFGSLTRTEGAADSYQSPFLYRAPEGLVSESGEQAVVDAFRYDIYSLGILSLELFTNQTLYKSFTDDWIDNNPSWTDVMYPRIYDVLEIKKFKHLVKKTFPHTEMKNQTVENMRDFVRGCISMNPKDRPSIDENTLPFLCVLIKKFKHLVKKTFPHTEMKNQTVENMRDFVRGCISMNPKDRPSIDEVLQHKVFGGSKLFPRKKNDVWIKKASSKKVQFLLSLHVGRAASLRLPPSSHSVFDSGDVDAPNENCPPENAVEMKNDIVPATKNKRNILKSVRNWFRGKWDKYVAVLQDK